MKTKYPIPVHRDIIITYILVLLGLVGGAASWAWENTKSNPGIQQTTTSQKVITQTEQVKVPIQTQILTTKVNISVTQLQPQTYWLQVEGEEIHLVPQKVTVKDGVSKEVALTEAFTNLLTNPKIAGFGTAIPDGTKLLNLPVKETGIYVNLSKEFTVGGGTTSMIYRVAQVVYTASSIDPKAKIFLSVEVKLLDENNPLGGEGIVLNQPVTRQNIAEDFSIS